MEEFATEEAGESKPGASILEFNGQQEEVCQLYYMVWESKGLAIGHACSRSGMKVPS